jgi:hypothetical protein
VTMLTSAYPGAIRLDSHCHSSARRFDIPMKPSLTTFVIVIASALGT